jgi:galactokinase
VSAQAHPRERVLRAFEREYGRPAEALVRAPGRVNLIGEHTDYNDGFVLPMALDRAAWIALAPRDDDVVRLLADDLDQRGTFRVESAARRDARGDAHADRGGWLEYPRAVAWALQADGGHVLRGFDGVLASDVPRGAGLSSSAAVELAVAAAFREASGFAWDPVDVARRMQRAENHWVGVASGIMDQLIGAAGVAGHALLIDCRDLTTRPVELPPDTLVVVLDTLTRRGLVGSAYNERRAQCEAAAAALGVAALRDADMAALESIRDMLDGVAFRRARHVITENERVQAAVRAAEAGDAAAFGRLMDASHASLQGDFEVSSEALDQAVAAARAAPGCLGARMTGAGFGGCAVALVEADATDAFVTAAAAGYQRASGRAGSFLVATAADGAGTEPDLTVR